MKIDPYTLNWKNARWATLGLGGACTAMTIWRRNPVYFLALYGTHFFEWLLVAKKEGRKVWYDDRRCLINTLLYGFTFWVPMKLEIE